jgi:hypothetical protein
MVQGSISLLGHPSRKQHRENGVPQQQAQQQAPPARDEIQKVPRGDAQYSTAARSQVLLALEVPGSPSGLAVHRGAPGASLLGQTAWWVLIIIIHSSSIHLQIGRADGWKDGGKEQTLVSSADAQTKAREHRRQQYLLNTLSMGNGHPVTAVIQLACLPTYPARQVTIR